MTVYKDYNGEIISKEEFLNKRDNDVKVFSCSYYEKSEEECFKLLNPQNIGVVTTAKTWVKK